MARIPFARGSGMMLMGGPGGMSGAPAAGGMPVMVKSGGGANVKSANATGARTKGHEVAPNKAKAVRLPKAK